LAHLASADQRELAKELEQLGVGTLWYPENRWKESFVQAAIYLGATTKMVVASGIASIYARDPVSAAAGARGLNDAWPNRFILGLGVTHAEYVEVRGRVYKPPIVAMSEYIDRLADAPWVGPDVAMPPVVLAALGPKMVDLAGARTAGTCPTFTTRAHIRSMREAMGPDAYIAVELAVIRAADRETARAIGEPHMLMYLSHDNYRKHLIRLGFSPNDIEGSGSDSVFDAVVAWGDDEHIVARAKELQAAGADHLMMSPVVSDIDAYMKVVRALLPALL
jgi:probable F420-dependent oxidoreductase